MVQSEDRIQERRVSGEERASAVSDGAKYEERLHPAMTTRTAGGGAGDEEIGRGQNGLVKRAGEAGW